MFWSQLEYTVLRLVRRWLLTDRLIERFAAHLPYVEENVGTSDPEAVASKWQKAAERTGLSLAGARIAELGSGRGFETGQVLLKVGALSWTGIEPNRVSEDPPAPLRHVNWAGELDAGKTDLILSHSVLEHIRQPDPLLADLRRALAPDGAMIHVVDYRDHFFKYPYQFLTFSEDAWRRWLDPGDLPRWRLYDHVAWFEQAGWNVQILDEERDAPAFERIKDRLRPPFDDAPDSVAVTAATLVVRPGGGS